VVLLVKQIVYKQYKGGQVVTKFADMSNIIASASQRNCRNLFKEAVAFARAINNDPEKKKAYLGKTAKNKSVFNAAIVEYMKRMKREGR
jgi:dimeric dUTPase (all-alpha-NTP-PPase superfamily)